MTFSFHTSVLFLLCQTSPQRETYYPLAPAQGTCSPLRTAMAINSAQTHARLSSQGPMPSALQNSYGPEMAATEFHADYGPQAVPLAHSTPEVVSAQDTAPYYAQQNQKRAHNVAEKSTKEKEKKNKIAGLPVAGFWLLVGGSMLLMLGVSLGVGLGLGLSSQRSAQSSSTAASSVSSGSALPTFTTTLIAGGQGQITASSPTSSSPTRSSSSSSSSSAPVTSGTTGLSANSCTSTAVRTYISASGTSFTEYCFTDWPNREAAADGNGTIADISRTTVYTFEACMEACVAYNSEDPVVQCAAVTYNSNLTSIVAVGRQGGNCFLKDKKGVDRQGSAESACAAIVY